MRFRQRAREEPPAADCGEGPRGRKAADPPPPTRTSITGAYLTDGRSLFRVQHAITEADGLHLDEPLLELEDCATLELILCSSGALERLGLRAVAPSDPGPGRARDGGAPASETGAGARPVRL